MISRLKDTLLLIGDSSSDRANLREIFQSGYDLLESKNVTQACMLLQQNGSCIAAVLADLPESDDHDLRRLLSACRHGSPEEIPLILFITPTETGAREELAYMLGVTDVVLRPYTPTTIQRRVQVIVDLFLHKWHLEKLVEEQSRTIRNTNQVMLDALSAIIEHRNTESGNHVLRIRRFTEILLREVARTFPEYELNENSIGVITSAAALHDIGKISIPDSILNKPGHLTEEEYEIIKSHTSTGSQLVQNLSGMGDEEYLRYAYNIALYHHERWDGTGYPNGLKGDEIPICAQVVGLADAFDALTSPRVYKPALPYDQAVNMILNGECGVFSPGLLECFKRVRADFVTLALRYADGYSPKDDRITMPLPGPNRNAHPLDSRQLSQIKYQSLLHYINATVLELDLDHDLYHVVYNPNPDLDALVPTGSFDEIIRQLRLANLHSEDAHLPDEIHRFLTEDFFRLNLRRRTFLLRIFSATLNDYRRYEMSFLRVNTGNSDQRIVISVWRTQDTDPQPVPAPGLLSPRTAPALRGLVSTILRCSSDEAQTVDTGLENLYTLTGYTAEEAAQLFDGKLLNLVFPADRSAVLAEMQQHLQQGGRRDLEYRMLRKGSEPIWVLDRCRVYTEPDGTENVYHAIRDNTRIRQAISHLEAEVSRHELLSQQSEGVIFDLDLNTDTMHCSGRWKDLFGYPPMTAGFTQTLAQSSHFHPDDLPALLAWEKSLVEGKDSHPYLEIRIVTSAGKYIWCRIHARLQKNETQGINRIVGILYDVDEAKRTTQALKEQAERDGLTKLLNKTSTQRLIAESLNAKNGQGLSAMLILDLDNFKSINDTYGHLYGDTVLSRIGSHLRGMFRSHDIIGRIGGDEFLIFLRDVPDVNLVSERCGILVENLRELLTALAPNLPVSCSIGAALSPIHATSYAELFRRADEALYLSKSRGKNCYRIYDYHESYAALLDNAQNVSTRIDSDEQPNIGDDSFIRFAFRALYESQDLDAAINELLAYVGTQFNVSRAYIFENNEDNTACSNTFEWCNEGILPEKDNLQNISYITDIPGWPELFEESGILYCSDIAELAPTARAILEPQGIKSMLHCSITDNGVFRGYIGFDDCISNRLWTQEQISLLQFLSEVMALFLLKKRTQDRVMEQADNLKNILDSQDDWVYVTDSVTYRLKFLNAKIKKLVPACQAGDLCYQALLGRDTPCAQCPMQQSDRRSTIKNDMLRLSVQASSTPVSWGGKAAHVITCRELRGE